MSAADLSAVAHELKTPLAVITGFAELLAARGDERTRAEAVKHIIEASGRLSQAVDDLLATLAQNDELAQSFLSARQARGLPE